jgi:RHS repeat-associated protein
MRRVIVAKGTLTSFSCDLGTNGFTATTESVLGQGGEQLSEVALDENGAMSWTHTNVYANGELFASYDPNGLHFLLTDWLGTRRMQTDYAGVPEQTCQGMPFGDGLVCTASTSAPTEHHFTGYQRDDESGNDYAEARYYAGSMGRFMSPDPSGLASADPTNPQSLNLYSYVTNSPLTSADPSGLSPLDPGSGCTIDGSVPINCSSVQNNQGALQCPNNDCSVLGQSYSGNNGGSFSLSVGANGYSWTNMQTAKN